MILSVALPAGAWADALNKPKGLPAGVSAKVERAKAESRRSSQGKSMKLTKGAECSPSVGTVKIAKGARAPREITTVVGDVISVCNK